MGSHLGGKCTRLVAATGAEYDPTKRTMAKRVAGVKWDQGPISSATKKDSFLG